MIQLTIEGMRQIFPRAPQDILEAFVAKQAVLDAVGITTTRTRLAYFFSNIEHECGGFTIKNLTENIMYTASRMAQVWPNRFPNGSADVVRKYGDGPGWQTKAFDDIYGNRMGNRPYTRDGSTFIGRGGPQWTGRDGYEALARSLQVTVTNVAGMSAEAAINFAISHVYQPEVCAAFWDWKRLNSKADAGDFRGLVKAWNGGYNGYADREALLEGNDPIIARLKAKDTALQAAKGMPGAPPTPKPPPEAIAAATREAVESQKRLTKAGTATTAVGAANEVGKATTTAPLMPGVLAWSAVGIGIAIVIVGAIVVARKRAAVNANWF